MRLKKNRLTSRESYDEIINRLLDVHSGKRESSYNQNVPPDIPKDKEYDFADSKISIKTKIKPKRQKTSNKYNIRPYDS